MPAGQARRPDGGILVQPVVFGGESQANSTAGETAGGVTMAMVMPSLSGSSDMSSGVISGFRRALVWADGGGGDGAAEVAAEATRCPSVVSR